MKALTPSVQQMETAFDALQTLMQDPNPSKQGRATLEAVFSLKADTEAYSEIYASILNMRDA